MIVKPYKLIVKVLSSEATESEIKKLDAWRSNCAANEHEFQNLKDNWLLAQTLQNNPEPQHSEDVWAKVIHKIHPPIKITKSYSASALIKIVSIAASIALIIGLGLSNLFTFSDNAYYTIVKTPNGQKAFVQLPDGTNVWLNSNTQLIYPANFNNNRIVELTGEAFFDVKKRNNQPFKVNANTISVNVLGTSFNVNAYPDENKIEVALLTGKVTIKQLHTDKLIARLEPNKKAEVLNDQAQTTMVSNCGADNIGLWRYGKLIIEDINMRQIVDKMEHWYGVNIQLNENRKQDTKRYWMTIKTESLTEMLQLINKITPINYKIEGEEVIIWYK